MFKRVKDFFKGETGLHVDKSGKPTDRDLHIATGVILLEMSGSDEDYAPEEVHTIFRTMEKQFGLTEDEASELLEISDKVREQSDKIDEFVKAINDNFDTSQRTKILAMIWSVVIADGKIEKFESRFANQMKTRFQLSDDDAKKARQLAETRKLK